MSSRAAWLLAIVCLAFMAGGRWYDAVRQGRAYDFGAFFFAAEAVRSGEDPYGAAPSNVPPYVYPPLLAQAAAALPRLPREAAYRWLSALTAAAGALALGLTLFHRQRGSADAGGGTLALGLGLFLILPFRDNLAQGQVNGLALLAIALAIWLEGRGQPLAAGLALAPAVLLKVTPVVFALWWLARRRVSSLAGLAAGAMALVMVSWAAGGSGLWASYLRMLRGLAAGEPPAGLPPIDALFNFSLAGFCARLLPSTLALAATLLALAALVALAARSAARAATPAAEHGALLAILALIVMAPPLAYRHHVILVFPAALLFLADAWREGARFRAALALLGLLLASVSFPERAAYLRLHAAGGLAPLLTSLNLYGLLLLFAAGISASRPGYRTLPPARTSPGPL